jgi:hypothetical protein
MADPSWGSGWPHCQGGKIRTLTRSDGVRLGVRAELVTLVSLLIDQTERLGYNVKADQTSGFACRQIFRANGTPTGRPSNHSWGVAVDINSMDNPFRRPLTTNIPSNVVEMWKRFGFRWGGTFSTTPDPMHFEYMGSMADAARHTLYAQIEFRDRGAGNGTTTTTTGAPPFPGLLSKARGSDGSEVCRVQTRLRELGFAIDKVAGCPFGPQTHAAVTGFQTQRHLGVYGVVGQKTWAALFA